MMITWSLRTLYCKILKIDVLLMRNRVWVACAKRVQMKIDIYDRAVFDSFLCESLYCRSFDSISRQNSYHILEIHDFWVDLKRSSVSDESRSRNWNFDFNLLTRREWSYLKIDVITIMICFRCRRRLSWESRRWERLSRLNFCLSHSSFARRRDSASCLF
jgi:hypothetical protein